jgi:hypothetical protein
MRPRGPRCVNVTPLLAPRASAQRFLPVFPQLPRHLARAPVPPERPHEQHGRPPASRPPAGADLRAPLPDRATARARRHGGRLSGHADRPQPAGRAQGPRPRLDRRRRGAGPLRTRGPRPQQPPAPQHRHDPRLRPRRRPRLHRDGVRQRGHPRPLRPQARPPGPRRLRADRRAGAQGPRRGPLPRHHPPRHQARQHHALRAPGPGQLRQDPRLRARQAGLRLVRHHQAERPRHARPACPPSRSSARRSTSASTCTPSASCSISCSRASCRSRPTTTPPCSTSTCTRRPPRWSTSSRRPRRPRRACSS